MLRVLYYNEELKMFGLWDIPTANEKTTIQVLRNLAPLYPLLDELKLADYRNKLSDAAGELIKKEKKSFNLGIYSPNFIPKRKVDDPLEAAWALLSADVSDKEQYLEIIQRSAKMTEETCIWSSPLAWAGSLQATASILRALIKRGDMFSL